jgi:hypothetical protein
MHCAFLPEPPPHLYSYYQAGTHQSSTSTPATAELLIYTREVVQCILGARSKWVVSREYYLDEL